MGQRKKTKTSIKGLQKEIGVMKVSEIKPSDYNPRDITEDALQGLEGSIDKFGLVEPIIVNKRNNRIVGGHQRFKVIQKKGIDEINVVLVDLDDDEEKALNIALNNPNTQGRFNVTAVELIESIRDVMPDLYDGSNIRTLHEDLLGFPTHEEEDEEEIGIEENEEIIPKMELQPFEHYDYVFVLSEDRRDFYKLCELLEIGKVNCSPIAGHKKIGLGRCISVKRLLNKLGVDTEEEYDDEDDEK